MHISNELAASLLPLLQRHAALQLEAAPGHDPRRDVLARELRAGIAGGNAIEGLNQNTDDLDRETFPHLLDTYWRVLCAFEDLALGGLLIRGGRISRSRTALEQPWPWMLHLAADAIEHAIAAGDASAPPHNALIKTFRSMVQPAYKRLEWPMQAAV